MIRMVPALMFMFLCGVLLLVLMQMEKPATTEENPLTAVAMPDLPLVNAKDLDAPLKQADYQGKVTVVNFFASWCGPCGLEMGELVKLHKENPKVHFIGVVWNDNPDTVNAWLKQRGNPFDELRYDDTGRASISLGLRGIPESFIIDDKGIVQFALGGSLTPDLRTQRITPLLKRLVGAHAS